MASNFSSFSAAINNLTDEEAAWAENYLLDDWEEFENKYFDEKTDEFDDPEEESEAWRSERGVDEGCELDWPNFAWGVESRPSERFLWLHSDESFDVLHLACFVSVFLEKFRPNEVWRCTYADTCSKPRIDEFGGGAIVVTAKSWDYMTTYELAEMLTGDPERRFK